MSKRRHVHIDKKQIRALKRNIDARQIKLISALTNAADDVLLNAEANAKELAPRDSGQLEQSITASRAVYKKGIISGTVGSNLVYALRRHEEEPREGVYDKYEDGVKYTGYYVNGRGEMTRMKPKVNGFTPGRKYLENSGTINQKHWKQEMNKAITDTYKGLT